MELQISTIENRIYEIRGRKVMLDFDLAEMYEVETRVLNQSVKRNMKRFPPDFMFQLTESEWASISSQFVMTSHIKRPKSSVPYVFTEQGIAMLSGLLNSDVAIGVNIIIMRAFVAIREYILSHASESVEIAQLRERVLMLEQATGNNTEAISTLYTAIDKLLKSPPRPQLDKDRILIGYKRVDKQ
ncbi:MAG: ORF6N domain-containing protein [Bacteroidetes bacterium]|nr:ORF6N domain-containing protein [Bacteroidota bacterium]